MAVTDYAAMPNGQLSAVYTRDDWTAILSYAGEPGKRAVFTRDRATAVQVVTFTDRPRPTTGLLHPLRWTQ